MTAKLKNPKPSPWRKGPNCQTKAAQALFARYVRKGKKS